MEKLVSIITPCYNSQDFIQETIQSVLDQSYKNWEMIIVDDHSRDDSVKLIKKYTTQDSRIKCIGLKENSGAAVCRNIAIKEAKGDYIAFLDSDDLWFPYKLEKQIRFMEKNGYALTYGSYLKIDEQGVLIENGFVKAKIKVSYKGMLTANKMGCLTVIYDMKVLGKQYMPLIRKRQDYALWLKILKTIPYAHGYQQELGQYRVRESSISSSKMEMLKWNWKLFREVEQRSFLASAYSLGMNVINKIFNF